MDDDIDIEEHDILEDPRIKKIFPDFSKIKIEINYNHENLLEDTQYNEESSNNQEFILPDNQQNFSNEARLKADTIDISDDLEEIQPNLTIPNGYEDVANDCEKIPEEQEKLPDSNEKITDDRENVPVSTKTYKVPIDYQESSGYSDFQSDINIKEEIDYEDYEENELPPEDIYHYKNKIILGTKPCSNSDCLELQSKYFVNDYYEDEHRKEYLPAYVLLENWQQNLENSSTYCKHCHRLFATRNALDAHKSTTHSLLVAVTKNFAIKSTAKVRNIARKSTSNIQAKAVINQARKSTGNVSTTFCNHCSKEFPDHTALIKHLYELLPLNNFSCEKCDAVFATQKELMEHNASHIKVEKCKGQAEKTKLKMEKAKLKVDKTKLQAKMKLDQTKKQKVTVKQLLFEEDVKEAQNKYYFAIPKSVLFQCGACKLNFISCFRGKLHADTCNGEPMVNYFECKICNRKIKNADGAAHKKQHKLTSNLKVYKITKNTYDRVLLECPKCHLHLTENSLIWHLKNKKCGKLTAEFCRSCEINIPKLSFKYHKKKHDKGFTKRDFIHVQNIMQTKVIHTRKLTAPVKKEVNKLAKNNKIVTTKLVTKIETNKLYKHRRIVFFFCGRCKSVCKRKSRNVHFKGNCVKYKTMICSKCGLQIQCEEAHNHLKRHHYKHFTIHDMFFHDVKTLKPIKLTLPRYHTCKHCGIKFNNEKAMQNHTCGENYNDCFCGDKFDVEAYKLHVEYHKKIDGIVKVPQPKLIKKPEMKLILYRCITCDIVTDRYDKAVEHSQNHDKTVKNRITIKCYICNLKFDDLSWKQHSSMHSENTVNGSDFKILTYSPDDLLTDEWLKLFQTLPMSLTRNIIKNSLYSIERSVQMKLIKDGRVEYTLYICSACEVCFQNSEITNHITIKCKSSENTCRICSLKFKDLKALKYHELLHVRVSNEHFRIVQFIKDTKFHTVYKCNECACCLTRKVSTQKHRCSKQNKNFMCLHCNQLYSKNIRTAHDRIHESEPNFNEKNIDVQYFDPLHGDAKTAKVFKCKCGLHFTTIQAVEKHSGNCSNGKVHSEKCSKCGLLFPTEILVSHLCRHHSNDTKISIEEYKVQSTSESPEVTSKLTNKTFDYKLYKCKLCDIYFLAQSTCYTHVSVPHKPVNSHECHICGLQFSAKSLYMHKRKHHEKYFNLNRVLVEEYDAATEYRPIKINLYMATDKLQSLLVSSST